LRRQLKSKIHSAAPVRRRAENRVEFGTLDKCLKNKNPVGTAQLTLFRLGKHSQKPISALCNKGFRRFLPAFFQFAKIPVNGV
jgi:hypothetical protein